MGIQYVQPVKVCGTDPILKILDKVLGSQIFSRFKATALERLLLQVVPYGEPVAAVDAKGQFSVPVDSPHSSDR